MSYVIAVEESIELLNRADVLRDTDMYLTRSDLDRFAFQRMYNEVDAYVQADEETGIDEAIIDDFDALLTEWESLLVSEWQSASAGDRDALLALYGVEVY